MSANIICHFRKSGAAEARKRIYIYDDLLYVLTNYSEVDVYDLKGNHVFWSDDLVGSKRFSEGFAVSNESLTDERSYITIDGKEAFRVNYSTGKMVF